MPAKARAVDLKPAVGRRLRAARSIVYPSSDACAAAFDIPVNTWRNYEKGERYPDPWHLSRFCDETGFTADFIYRGRLLGIREDVQIRLAAAHPAFVDEAPDMGSSPMPVERPATRIQRANRRDDAPGDPLVGDLIDDPDELAWVAFWRRLTREERTAALKRLRPPTAVRKRA